MEISKLILKLTENGWVKKRPIQIGDNCYTTHHKKGWICTIVSYSNLTWDYEIYKK